MSPTIHTLHQHPPVSLHSALHVGLDLRNHLKAYKPEIIHTFYTSCQEVNLVLNVPSRLSSVSTISRWPKRLLVPKMSNPTIYSKVRVLKLLGKFAWDEQETQLEVYVVDTGIARCPEKHRFQGLSKLPYNCKSLRVMN